uniref:Uncharacterized protein n=1 Tax=Timema douglasi TaxID=61478 RepID=A0A7R8ZBL6_TIMDO|nr:unnamed protein product [Timema douglasi]
MGVIRGDGREGPGCALHKLIRITYEGITLNLSLKVYYYISDEEIGGIDGMDKFVKTSHFLKLNVGFILDEGITSSDKNFVLFYGERSLWTVHIHCTSPNRKNSTEKVQIVVDHFVQFRQEQKVKLDSNPRLTPRDLTSMTLKAVKVLECSTFGWFWQYFFLCSKYSRASLYSSPLIRRYLEWREKVEHL